jgi:multiple sugar transport system ATP-binding protein
MAKVSLKNVTKIFDGKVRAINNVTLDVADEEFLVIVGPSGCGKTTALRLVAGLEEPTSGTIIIGDRVVNDVPANKRDVAMVFQNYALYPHMTVFENLAFALKVRKQPKVEVEKRVKEVAKMLDIETLLDMRPATISGGQRQRIALGRAIVQHPRVFLLDEPLSNLDTQLRLATRTEVKSLQRRLKTTTIFVTHDQAEAMMLGDRICVMYEGSIRQIGTPIEIYSKPSDRFVAGFFGMPPMNFFQGRIEYEGNMPKFCLHRLRIGLPVRIYTKMPPYKDREIVLGVRPEHISLIPIPGRSDNVIRAVLDLLEPLGARAYAYLTSTFGDKFVADVNPRFNACAGDSIQVYIDIDQVHLFETGEMGKNIDILD